MVLVAIAQSNLYWLVLIPAALGGVIGTGVRVGSGGTRLSSERHAPRPLDYPSRSVLGSRVVIVA